MSNQQFVYRSLYRLGFLVYGVLLLLALVFYKERIILLDDALYTFNILRKGSFSIEHNRFISVFTEVFPLLASKFSFSLKHVTMAYSAGFIIYYFICYFITGTVFKNYRFALVLLLFNTLFLAHTFYWMLSELTQGVALLVPLLGYIEGRSLRQVGIIRFLVIIAVLITLVFAHPLILFPVTFGVLFLLLNTEGRGQRLFYLIVGGCFILLVAAKMLFVKEAYDSQSMQSINNVKGLFPHYLYLHSNKMFVLNCLDKYYWIPICFLLTVIVYIKQARWAKLALYLLYIPGFLLLINISYYSSDVYEFYIENLYLPAGFLIALPFVFDVLPHFRKPLVSYALISAILLTALVRIYAMHKPYTARIDWLRHYYITHSDAKYIVHEKTVPKATVLMSWGSPYEFWLLSTIETGKSASILIHQNLKEIEWMAFSTNSLATTWGVFPYAEMDKRYFKFTDTVSTYRLIE